MKITKLDVIRDPATNEWARFEGEHIWWEFDGENFHQVADTEDRVRLAGWGNPTFILGEHAIFQVAIHTPYYGNEYKRRGILIQICIHNVPFLLVECLTRPAALVYIERYVRPLIEVAARQREEVLLDDVDEAFVSGAVAQRREMRRRETEDHNRRVREKAQHETKS